MNIISNLKENILNTISQHFNLEAEQRRSIIVALNTDKEDNFGDLSCNAAMILAKIAKKSTQKIAEEIKNLLNEKFPDTIEKIEIAGPGFLNIFLTKKAWLEIIGQLFALQNSFYLIKSAQTKKYLVEFVSANPTGPLHLGHGRGGIIGDVLGNVLKFLGNTVEKEFYINDAGTQIQKLGESFKVRCQQELGIKVELPEKGYAGLYLVDLAKECVEEFDEDVLLKQDKFFVNYAKAHMLEKIKVDLKAYGIKFDNWFSEKSLHEDGSIKKVLDELLDKNLAYEKDGALWFRSTDFGDEKDRVLRKKDGELTYISADIAYHKNKFERGFDILFDVLGQDHHGYVTRLKGTMQALGYNADDLNVILYQLVTLKQGEEALRMSKRAGTFVTLRDIIDEVGTDVARFFYLNRKSEAHLDFDLDVALKKTEENPVYYIQYAYVRTGSLLEKAKVNSDLKMFIENFNTEQLCDAISKFINKDEIEVMKKIISLQEILYTITNSHNTHLLAYYSLELAHRLHNYYAHNRIIDLDNIEQSKVRLFLIMLMRNSLELCLNLLGLSKPKKM
ncbi:MAG: arginine--tRNA ligase [bacterium]